MRVRGRERGQITQKNSETRDRNREEKTKGYRQGRRMEKTMRNGSKVKRKGQITQKTE